MARRIVAAAYRIVELKVPEGGFGAVILSLPPPARHCHLIWAARALGFTGRLSSDMSGFIDNEGRFVGRKEAAEVALASGQIDKLGWPPDLYSEDLW